MHEHFINLVNRDVEYRTDDECFQMAPWLQNHSPLFKEVPEGNDVTLHTVISLRHENSSLV